MFLQGARVLAQLLPHLLGGSDIGSDSFGLFLDVGLRSPPSEEQLMHYRPALHRVVVEGWREREVSKAR